MNKHLQGSARPTYFWYQPNIEAYHRPEAPQDCELLLRQRLETENEEIQGHRVHPDPSGRSSEVPNLPSGQQECPPEALKSAQAIKDLGDVISSLQEQVKVPNSETLQELSSLRSRVTHLEHANDEVNQKLSDLLLSFTQREDGNNTVARELYDMRHTLTQVVETTNKNEGHIVVLKDALLKFLAGIINLSR